MKSLHKRHVLLLLLFLIVITFNSCAPAEYTDKQYGFFSGIIHGFALTFALLAKLFGMDYALYAENNTGFTYWLGFILALFFLGGSGYSSRRR